MARFFCIKGIKTIIIMVALTLTALPVRADYYVTFTDGRLHVFPSSSVEGMTIDAEALVFTAKDGETYSYPRSTVSSIKYQLTKELPRFASFKINDKENYQVVTDAYGTITDNTVKVTVGGIGKWLTATFELSDDQAKAFVNGKVQKSGVSRLHYDAAVNYTIGYPGDMILRQQGINHYAMVPYGNDYAVEVDFLTDHSTGVPRIDINTVGGVNITSKKVYVDAEIIIDGAGVFPSMTDSVKIKGRGNTSWSSDPNAKNPYRLKFDHKVKPLGLTKGKSWVLLANKMVASMLSNAIGMKASSLIGTAAANHMIPVDLYINGTYKGSYNFTEKIGFSNNSIDLDDETVAALLELDKYYDEATGQKFKSSPGDLPVNIKEPEFAEGTTSLTLSKIKSRFNAFAKAVNNGYDLADYVDIDQLARYLLATDLLCNKEYFHPKSVFCYYENVLEDSSKLVFGPMWDLDWACGYYYVPNNTYFESLVNYNFFYSNYPVDHYEFMRKLGVDRKVSKRMYQLCKSFIEEGLDELCDFCGEYFRYAEPSLLKSRTAYPDDTDYEAQSQKAPEWLRNRINFIYERLKSENRIKGDVDGDGEVNISDVTALIDYLLSGNASMILLKEADVNSDGKVNIGDVTALIDGLLQPE